MNDAVANPEVDRIRTLLEQGETAQAEQVARTRNTRDVRDFELHTRWADVLEEAGLMDEVLFELNLALRDRPDDRKTLERLAEIHLDQGQPEKAAHYLNKLAELYPQEPGVYQSLGRVLEETGEYEKAKVLYQKGIERTGDAGLKGLLHALDFLSEDAGEPPAADGKDVLVPGSHHLVEFVTLFSGREGVYARQWASPTGESGYTPVHEPFTLKVAEQHIVGNITVGIYPLRLDQTVNFIAFDVDMAKPVVRRVITSKSAWDQVMERLHRVACRIVDAGAAADLPVFIEDSGFKGRHAWIFLETPTPAGVARKCGHVLLSSLGPVSGEVNIEVFPKQSRVAAGGLGNLIKLPLGFHKKTGRRSVFLEPGGEPYANQLEFMEKTVKASRRAVYALIQKMGGRPAAVGTPAKPEEEAPWEGEPSLPAVAQAVEAPYDLEQDARFQCLLVKCAVLRTIVERIYREAALSREEAVVLIHSVGHLEHGSEAVNQLLARCAVTDPSLLMKSPLRGNPVSCPKIRARIPHITASVSCNCRFDPMSSLYPSPLNHLRDLTPATPEPGAGRGLESIRFHHLVESYLKTRKQIRELALQMEQLEQQLNRVFDSAGVEEIHTSLGVLKRVGKDTGSATFALEI